MKEMATQVVSPWSVAAQQRAGIGNDSDPLLILGPVGSLPLECAKELHRTSGGGNFERVSCTPDSVVLRVQVVGPPVDIDTEFPLFEPERPNSAVYRAAGGTLFFDCIDRCNPVDGDWIRLLLARQPVSVNGNTVELDPNTRVVASITDTWMDGIERAVPQWLKAVFGRRVVTLDRLGSRSDDILEAMDWFSSQAVSEDQSVETLWSNEAKELLVHRQWPGGYEELRDVVRSVIAANTGELITLDSCKRVIARYELSGMRAVDNYRRQECYDYSNGLLYMGRPTRAIEIYRWAEQFTRVAGKRRFDPWVPGLKIVQEISNRYYYSSDQLRILIRNAYSSLCVELADRGYISNWSSAGSDGPLPDLQALLVNPLGPVKSSAGVLPHMAHLLGAGRQQEVVPVENVSNRLTEDENTQVVLFCDDFAGTGHQILTQIVRALANDKVFQGVCESRAVAGRPIALGVILGVGFADALTKIRMSGPKWLPVFVHAGERLEESDRAFSFSSSIFPDPELRAWAKALVVDEIGGSLVPRWPGGFGDTQALVVTADNSPNDTLPVIWCSGWVQGIEWKALFERASTPSGRRPPPSGRLVQSSSERLKAGLSGR